MFLLLCLFDLLILFFLSRMVTREVSRLLGRFTGRMHVTIALFSSLFFFGTLVHELAHFFVAHVMGVRVHDFTLTPRLEEKHLRLGSVSIQKTDSFRKFCIGIAPLLLGLTLLFLLLWWVARPGHATVLVVLIAGFFIFQISNTMFPSRADISGTIPAMLLLIGLVIAMIFLIPASQSAIVRYGQAALFQKGVYYLTFVIGVDVLTVIILYLLRGKNG